MRQFLTISLLSVACLATPSAALLAQQAIDTKPRQPAPPAAREQMQVRLAEVIAMLEEDDLSPEQRERALAKLTEIRDRLAKEGDGTRNAARASGEAPAAPRRARFRAIETQPGESPEAIVVELAPPAPPPSPAEPPDAVAPTAPVPPAPPTRIRNRARLLELAEAENEARIAEVRAKTAQEYDVIAKGKAQLDKAREYDVIAKGKAQLDDARAKLDAAVVELEAGQRVHALRGAKMADELAKVYRGRVIAERDARSDHVDSFGRYDVVVRPKISVEHAEHEKRAAHDEAEDDDLREMVEEMRAEMREIRALIRELRTRSSHDEATRRNAQAPAAPSSGSFGVSGNPGAAASGGGGSFASPAPAWPSVPSGAFGAGSSAGVLPSWGKGGTFTRRLPSSREYQEYVQGMVSTEPTGR